MSNCPLCESRHTEPHTWAHDRSYVSCFECGLIFVPADFHPSREEERRRYETHQNDPSDEGYRSYLRRLSAPLTNRITPPASGLDYGAGPGPTLSIMLEEQGFDMQIYDPFFADRPDVLRRTYDFITCTETAEHFRTPRAEFEKLFAMLYPAGWLAIMTQWADERDFEQWRYARDVTHVCFYRRRTMRWIADHFGYELHIPRRDVALLKKLSR